MKEELLKSAGGLVQPSGEACEEFSRMQGQMAEKGSQILSGREDLGRLIGEGNWSMARDNNRNFARFMESIFSNDNPEGFTETVLWVFRAYRAHGFQTTYWAANLNIWMEVLEQDMSPAAFQEIEPFYDWLIVNIPVFTLLSESEVGGAVEAH